MGRSNNDEIIEKRIERQRVKCCRGHGYRNEKYYNIKIKWHLRDEQKAKIS